MENHEDLEILEFPLEANGESIQQQNNPTEELQSASSGTAGDESLTADDIFSTKAIAAQTLDVLPLAVTPRATYTRSTSAAGAHTHSVSTGSAGAHTHNISAAGINNYIAVNVWRRIS